MALLDQVNSINKDEFTKEFLNKYLELGFGSLSKHDIDLLVYYLIKKHSKLFNGKSNYELSSLLKITERKLQSIQIESYLRYENISISINLNELIGKIGSGDIKPEIEGDKIRILIDSPVLKRDFEYAITTIGHLVDYSFNKNILTLRLSSFFEALGNTASGIGLKKQLIDFLRKQQKNSEDIQIEIEQKSWWSKQFSSFKTAVKEEAAQFIFKSILSVLITHMGGG
ncbi:hypothetical protein [Legionella maioricensis]|uniref:Uncharacterized protein n=1 Tax=Legionella maioricensis TaxID=2896528 RepID=A0A9X2ICF6_9GAMM|nr:hypothetical protein [Legionella maioricensis]MCL9685879.1 hypothetical protein [Legionella maioricensis]MCL9689297.1 hypothetical protein [Legionella maioricensis]